MLGFLHTFFKTGTSLWIIKIEMYISVNILTAYAGMAHRQLNITQVSIKDNIGSTKAENHRKQTAYLVSFCRVIKT